MKINSVKKIKLLLFCMICVAFVSGCGKVENSKKVKLKFLSLGGKIEEKLHQNLIIKFTAENPDIEVQLIPIGGGDSTINTKILTMIAGGTSPDVYWTAEVFVREQAMRDAVMNLEPLISEDKDFKINDYYKEMIDIFRFNKKLYGMPREVGAVVLVYNKDMFDKTGLKYPDEKWTWDDFIQAGIKLTKDTDGDGRIDQFGVNISPNRGTNNMMVWGSGGSIFSEDGKKCTIDTPEAIAGMKKMFDMILKYKITPVTGISGANTSSDIYTFVAGKVAMEFNVRPGIADCRLKIKNFKWEIAPVPKGSKKRATIIGAAGYSISNNTKYPKEAWKFLKFLIGPVAQEEMTKTGTVVPVLKKLAKSELFMKITPPENNWVFVDTLKYGKACAIVPRYGESEDIMKKYFDLVIAKEIPVEEACNKIAKYINKLFNEAEK